MSTLPGRRLLALCLSLLLLPLLAPAQDADVDTLPWAYSSYFGTGWYRVGDNRDAFVIRTVPRRVIRESRLTSDGERQVGAHWRIPVTIGLNQFPLDDITGSVNPDNVASLSVVPGLYLDIPVNDRWTLRPFLALGWGGILDGSDSAWSYWGGTKSRYRLTEGTLQTSLINSLGFVGYSPRNGPSENFWPLRTALELQHPLWELNDGKDQLQMIWHLSHTHFHGDLELLRPGGAGRTISEEWELGLAFAKRSGPFKLWRFEFQRLGLAYRFSSDGELEGIGLVFNSLFDE